jgi:Ca2+-binding EF-hand superfamily protein
LECLLNSFKNEEDDFIDFEKLMIAIENFSKNNKSEKLKILFNLMDRNNDGFIDLQDL